MHDALKEGDMLLISEPRNHFPLVHAQRTLLFAGGIGVTPLLCMAQRLAQIGADFTPALLHPLGRAHRLPRRDRRPRPSPNHVDSSTTTTAMRRRSCSWRRCSASRSPARTSTSAGRPASSTGSCRRPKRLGWGKDQVHLEYFGAAPQDTTGDRAFQVKIASSGATYEIPADQTVVQALQAHGVEILTSCEQGVCGTCITRVLQGECDHRDLYFTDEEKAKNDQFTPCCSRAKSGVLVLEWWSWRELNPRPQAFSEQFYMFSV
jgi:vanillate O-demethylase ferredoxin subunit